MDESFCCLNVQVLFFSLSLGHAILPVHSRGKGISWVVQNAGNKEKWLDEGLFALPWNDMIEKSRRFCLN